MRTYKEECCCKCGEPNCSCMKRGRRSHQVSVNADRDIDKDFVYDEKSGVYTSHYRNKFGAADSFSESWNSIYQKALEKGLSR